MECPRAPKERREHGWLNQSRPLAESPCLKVCKYKKNAMNIVRGVDPSVLGRTWCFWLLLFSSFFGIADFRILQRTWASIITEVKLCKNV